MHPIEALPDAMLQAHGPIAEQFLQQGLKTFHAACRWTKNLPYAANSNSENSLILFEEGYGNCTTKHGAIARLAQEHGLPVHKNLGFYRLNDAIVTGVNALLHPYGLDFIPQIHCFLVYEECRVDLTEGNCNGKNKTIEDYDFVLQVAPDLSHAQHQAYYLEFLRRYKTFSPQLATLSDSIVMDLLADCRSRDRDPGLPLLESWSGGPIIIWLANKVLGSLSYLSSELLRHSIVLRRH